MKLALRVARLVKRRRQRGAAHTSGTVTVLDHTYSFVAASINDGQVKSVTNNVATGRSQTYTYDEMNRLASAQSQATSGQDCWGQSFGYDRYANLHTINVTQCSAPILSLSISTTTNRITNSGFTYDAAGELLTDGFGGTFTWNAEGRMAATAGVTYTYDGDGRRVKKSDGRNLLSTGRGGTTNSNRKLYWYGLGGAVLAESDLSGTITAEFIYFSGARIARRDLPSGTVYYFLADRLGTARVLTNASGTVVEESDFYPYGTERPIKTDHNVKNTYKFTGHERDTESGLDHTLHRQYASNTGRWHSVDSKRGKPGNPQSWNRYAYVSNNPCNATDPLGDSEHFPPWPEPLPLPPGWIPVPHYNPFEWWEMVTYGPTGPCDLDDPHNNEVLKFMAEHEAAAQRLGVETGLSNQFILAWSAFESGWGTSYIADHNNNYFGLTAGRGVELNGWIGDIDCSELDSDPNLRFACFQADDTFFRSGRGALNERYLSAALAAQGADGIDPVAIANAIAAAGFNDEYPKDGYDSYGDVLKGFWNDIQERLDCPR